MNEPSFFLLDFVLFHVLPIAMLLQCRLENPAQETISLILYVVSQFVTLLGQPLCS